MPKLNLSSIVIPLWAIAGACAEGHIRTAFFVIAAFVAVVAIFSSHK